MNYILKSYLYIPKTHFDENLQSKLIIKLPDNIYKYNKEEGSNLSLYKDIGNGYIRIPRYSITNNLGLLIKKHNIEIDSDIIPININFNSDKFILNNSQVKTVSNTLEKIKDDLSAVIVADPGEGKTLMAIKIICELKLKTIVLVHKDYLIKQWINALLEYTDLTEPDIGILKAGKFKDGKVVIGSQQSLMKKTIDNSINRMFSFKIQDEVHRIGALMFLKSYTRFNTMYSLGLSATPHRTDKMEKLYFFHTSGNLIKHESVRNIKAKYLFIPFMSENHKWKTFPPYIPYRTQLIHNLLLDAERNNMAIKIILIAMKNNRKIIVLSEFIDILDKYYDILVKELPDKNIVRFYGSGKRIKMYQNDLTTVVTKDKLNSADIILASYKKAMEGVDIPNLDTLLMLTPIAGKVGLKQAIGRIERFVENKKEPLVIDIIDNLYNFTTNIAQNRMRLYELWKMEKYTGKEFNILIKST